MGRLALIGRLAARDLRRRPAQAVLLLIAIMAATTTLTLGLALHGVTSHPYQQTRAATAGPDVVAEYGPPGPSLPVPPDARPLIHASGVTEHSGPFLAASVVLRAHGIAVSVLAEGRGTGRATVDQPLVTAGTWVRPGTVVLERTLATALGVGPGDSVTMGGRRFKVAGPLLTSPGAGLVGAPGAPSLTPSTIGLVAALALAVALVATLVPALRAARTSTVVALADTARPPRRRRALVAVTRRLPATLLIGLRLAGRRPRRLLLSMVSTTVTTTGIVAVLAFHAMRDAHRVAAAAGLANPVAIRDDQVLGVLTVALVALAGLNAVVSTWATVLDTRHSAALTRALGATPGQVSAGLSAAQLIAALPGVLLGIPAGLLLYKVANGSGQLVTPPAWWLASAAAAILAAVAALALVSARAGTQSAVAGTLETA